MELSRGDRPRPESLDREGIIDSVSKTHRALISEEAEAPVGVGSEVMAIINEGCFYELDCAPCASLNVPVPYNHHLEAAAIPDASWVVKAALEMFGSRTGSWRLPMGLRVLL